MGTILVISGADFSTNAIPVAKAVSGTISPQYVYAANVVNPSGSFDWDAHKVRIRVNSDGCITSFNLDDNTTAIPFFVRGGEASNSWLQEIDLTYLSRYPIVSFQSVLNSCTALKHVVLGGKFPNVTGNDTTKYMFYGCTALEDVVIDDSFGATGLSDIQYIFYNSNLKSVSGLKNLIKSSAQKLGYLFCNCRNLKEVDLTDCNTANVTTFTFLFSGCVALERIDGINAINTGNVTDFTSMFYATKVNNLNISSWNIAQNAVTTRMFNLMTCNELNANCFTALYGDISQMFFLDNWNTIHLDNLNDVSAVTSSDNLFSSSVSGTPKITIANVTNEAVKTLLKSKLNAVSAGGSSNWQEATVGGVLCLVPNV